MQKTLTMEEDHGNSEREREGGRRVGKRTNVGQKFLDSRNNNKKQKQKQTR